MFSTLQKMLKDGGDPQQKIQYRESKTKHIVDGNIFPQNNCNNGLNNTVLLKGNN